MPQLRVCDERAVGAGGAQGQIPATEERLGSALTRSNNLYQQTRLRMTAALTA